MAKTISGFWLTEWFRTTSPDERMRVIGEVQQRFIDRRWTTDVAEIIPFSEAIAKLPTALAARNGKILLSP
jgi:NADPH:quinone reductase-like Zn-dependent oxidoreductase